MDFSIEILYLSRKKDGWRLSRVPGVNLDLTIALRTSNSQANCAQSRFAFSELDLIRI